MNQSKPQFIIPSVPKVGLAYDMDNAPEIERDVLALTRDQQEHLPIIDHIVGAGIKYVFDPKSQGYVEIGPVDYAPKQGWYIYHVGKKLPQPGFPTPHSLRATERPKRNFINWIRVFTTKEMLPIMAVFMILPRRIKAKILEHFLERYLELAEADLKTFYPAVEYFLPVSLEIKGFITVFLTSFGISLNTANRFAYAFAMLIETDTAYRLRIMDLLTETTKEKMLANPIKESARLLKILAERDNRKHLVEKFGKFVILMRFGYFFIRKPFRNALIASEFHNLQYDEVHRDFVKHWTTYNFFGKTIEERVKMYPVENYPKYVLN